MHDQASTVAWRRLAAEVLSIADCPHTAHYWEVARCLDCTLVKRRRGFFLAGSILLALLLPPGALMVTVTISTVHWASGAMLGRGAARDDGDVGHVQTSSRSTTVRYRPAKGASEASLHAAAIIVSKRLTALGRRNSVRVHDGDIVANVATTGDAPSVEASLQAATAIGLLLLRPVLCDAAPYRAGQSPATSGSSSTTPVPTSCVTPRSGLMITGNGVETGMSYSNILTEALADVPSSAVDSPTSTVLLPGLRSRDRYLLGPSILTGSIVKSAHVHRTSTLGQWTLNVVFTSRGLAAWNAMIKQYLHKIIGFDFDGVVVTAPITDLTASTFRTFRSVQLSGNFSKEEVETLVADLDTGPLPVALARAPQIKTAHSAPTGESARSLRQVWSIFVHRRTGRFSRRHEAAKGL